MTSKEIARALRKQGEDLKKKADELIDIARRLDGATSPKPDSKSYDQDRINSDLADAISQNERRARRAG